jgi:hypothetical protein
MVANPYRVKVVRGVWSPPPASATPGFPWSPAFCRALFQDSNGWSLRDFWLRSSFGILNLDFDIEFGNPYVLDGLDANYLSGRRRECIDAVRQFMRERGLHVDGYDGFIALITPPPCNAGSLPSREALFDQGGFLEFFQHELGHVLGLAHAFGPDGGDSDHETVYEDDWCVMGWTNPQSFTVPIPPEAASVVSPLSGQFWQSGRRAAAATIYRWYPSEFSPWIRRFGFGERVVIGAASAVAAIGSPDPARPLAVLTLPEGGELAIEYRVPTVDDRGLLTAAVVVHSIGRRDVGLMDNGHPFGEVNPIFLEGTLAPVTGSRIVIGGGGGGGGSTDLPGFVLGEAPPVVQVRVDRV